MAIIKQQVSGEIYLAAPSDNWQKAFLAIQDLTDATSKRAQLSGSGKLAYQLVLLAQKCRQVTEHHEAMRDKQEEKLRESQKRRLCSIKLRDQLIQEQAEAKLNIPILESQIEALSIRETSRRERMDREIREARCFSNRQKVYSWLTLGVGYFFNIGYNTANALDCAGRGRDAIASIAANKRSAESERERLEARVSKLSNRISALEEDEKRLQIDIQWFFSSIHSMHALNSKLKIILERYGLLERSVQDVRELIEIDCFDAREAHYLRSELVSLYRSRLELSEPGTRALPVSLTGSETRSCRCACTIL